MLENKNLKKVLRKNKEEVNSNSYSLFHALGLIKTEEEKRKDIGKHLEENRKRKEEQLLWKHKQELLKLKLRDKLQREKEQKQQKRKEKIFNLFHSLGLVKTEEDIRKEEERLKRKEEEKTRVEEAAGKLGISVSSYIKVKLFSEK